MLRLQKALFLVSFVFCSLAKDDFLLEPSVFVGMDALRAEASSLGCYRGITFSQFIYLSDNVLDASDNALFLYLTPKHDILLQLLLLLTVFVACNKQVPPLPSLSQIQRGPTCTHVTVLPVSWNTLIVQALH